MVHYPPVVAYVCFVYIVVGEF